MSDYLFLIIAFPLAGAVFLHFFGRFLKEPVPGWLATTAIGGSFAIAVVATLPFISGDGHGETVLLWEWMPAIGANFEILWDPLSALMTLIVTGVGTLIHIFAIGYMHGDERFSRFFTNLNLFAASMLTLVLVRPILEDTTISPLERLVSLGYPVLDIVLLVVAMRLAMGAGRRSASFRLLMVSLLVTTAADLAYAFCPGRTASSTGPT